MDEITDSLASSATPAKPHSATNAGRPSPIPAFRGAGWIESWPMKQLKPFPGHDALRIPELSAPERAALQRDIAENGLEHPLQIAEDGTVLAGHERYLALRALGRTHAPCEIRSDLDAYEKRVAFVIRDNLFRRQLSTAQKAALVIKLAELRGLPVTVAAGLSTNSKIGNEASPVRISAGALTERTAVAAAAKEAPGFAVVERMADRGEVSLHAAASAAKLAPEKRAVIAKRLEETPAPKRKRRLLELVREHEQRPDGDDMTLEHALDELEGELSADSDLDESSVRKIMDYFRAAAEKTPTRNRRAVAGFVKCALEVIAEST